MKFAENLARMRKQRGWTQMDVSIKSGINAKTLSSYENGRTEPSLGEVRKLCDIFDCSISSLTGTKEHGKTDLTLEDIFVVLNKFDMDELEEIAAYIKHISKEKEELFTAKQEAVALRKRLEEYEKRIRELESK